MVDAPLVMIALVAVALSLPDSVVADSKSEVLEAVADPVSEADLVVVDEDESADVVKRSKFILNAIDSGYLDSQMVTPASLQTLRKASMAASALSPHLSLISDSTSDGSEQTALTSAGFSAVLQDCQHELANDDDCRAIILDGSQKASRDVGGDRNLRRGGEERQKKSGFSKHS